MNKTTEAKRPGLLTRREAILKTSAMLGGATLIGQAAMLAGCEAPVVPEADETATNALFSSEDVAKLTEIAETILPETDTPGARAAGVGPFIALMVTDCYSPSDQAIFRAGLVSIDEESQQEFGGDFMSLSPAERLAMVERLDRERFEASESGAEGEPHYFRMLKELTVFGFFTSEAAYNEVLEYVEAPGRYEPCRELEADTRVFAQHGANIS